MKSIGIVGIVGIGIVISFVFGCGQGEDEYYQDVVDLTDKPPEVAYAALKCAKCHGAEREGQRTAPTLINLSKRWTEDKLVSYIRNPQAVIAVTPRLAYMAERYPIGMPAYPHTDEEVLRGLTAWILEK
jgi:hypothetical protein